MPTARPRMPSSPTRSTLLGWPDAVTIDQRASLRASARLCRVAAGPQGTQSASRIASKDAATSPSAIEDAKDELWRVNGRRQVIYAKAELCAAERLRSRVPPASAGK